MKIIVFFFLFMTSLNVFSQQISGMTKLERLSMAEIREGILAYPKNGTFYVDNNPLLHAARNSFEYMDSLFIDNPFRNDYASYTKILQNRFRKEAVCSVRGVLFFTMVDSLDKHYEILDAEGYWRKINETDLPKKVWGVTSLVRFVDSYLNSWHSDILDLQKLRFYVSLKFKNVKKTDFPTTKKKYFEKLGISQEGIDFKEPKYIVVQ